MKKIALVFLGNHTHDARCMNMINSLTNQNHIVSIYSTATSKHMSFDNQKFHEYSIRYSLIPYIKYVLWILRVYNVLRTQSYDIIIAADLYSLIPACLLSKRTKIVYDSREIYTKLSVHLNRPIINKIIEIAERACIKRVNKIIVTAKSDQKYLQKNYNTSSVSFCIIYNFPSLSLIHQKSSFLRDRLNIPKNSTILLYQGVIQKNRGILQLIKIIENTTQTVGVVVGDGSYLSFLKKYIQINNLESRMFMLSAVPYYKLLEITASADIGVSLVRPAGLSNLYALPNKLFEYALARIPTLASDLPNIKKYIDTYHLGWCVDDRSLTKQIALIKNYQSSGFSTLPFNKYKALFSWESQEKAFNNFIFYE